jgi:hypothetical protein
MGVQSGFIRKASGYCAFALSLLLASCGGGSPYGGGGGGMGMGSYTIGGSVTGLAMGKTLVLHELYLMQDVTIMATGVYAFSTPVATGAIYVVSVNTMLSTTTQTCTVSNPSGTVGMANITNVNVSCV